MRRNYNYILLIVFIILVAFFVRIWGINFGLPSLHVFSDENEYVTVVRSVLDQNIQSPYKEGIPFNSFYYLLLFVYFLFKKFLISINFLTYDFWWWGRLFSAILSTASVFLTYSIAKKLFNKKVGILSSLILTVTFIDVLVAHYIKEDVYLQFFGLMAIFFFIKTVNNEKYYNYILAILFIILAGLAKLNGLFFSLPFLFWGIFSSEKEKSSLKKIFNKKKIFTFICILSVMGVIVISNPISYREQDVISGRYETVDINQKFSFNKLLSPESSEQIVSSDQDGIKNYLWWPLYLMTSGFYYPLFFLVIFGLIYFILKYQKQKKHLVLKYIILMVVLYYLLLSFQHSRFDRWITIITPLIVIFSAAGIFYFLDSNKNIRWLKGVSWLFIITILLFSFLRIDLFDFFLFLPDNRQIAFNWITRNISREKLLISQNLGVLHNKLYEDEYNVKNIPADSKDFWYFNGDLIIFDDVLYNLAYNYKDTDKYKDFYRNLDLVLKKGKSVKVFSNIFFSKGFFSPHYLMAGSVVNLHHDPTIYVYKIPDIGKKLSINLFKEEYFYNLKKREDECFSSKELKNGWRGDIFRTKEMLLPKGNYALNMNALVENNKIQDKRMFIDVWSEGRGSKVFSTSLSLNAFKKVNELEKQEINFILKNSQRVFINIYFIKSVDICVRDINLIKIN